MQPYNRHTLILSASLILMLSLNSCFRDIRYQPPTAYPTQTRSIQLSPTFTTRPTITPLPSPTLQPTTPLTLIKAVEVEPVQISPVGQTGVLLTGTDGLPWWNDAVFYEIFVRSFYDSDGDGIGDIKGLAEKLDYLNDGDPSTSTDLGITGLWLMPIMQSPSYHGYDITNYYEIESDYGTNEDFLQLVDAAHARGIHVIIDLVLNHTSAAHPWFQQSRDVNSEFRDWYIWADKAGIRGWHKDTNGYYFGLFWDQMPDLNYTNPVVTAEMRNIIAFWLNDMGVDGFRLDAIKHLIEDGNEVENTAATHEWLTEFFTFYKGLNGDALTVGEVWSPTEQIAEYTGDEVDIAFEFDLADSILTTAFSGRKFSLSSRQEKIIETYPPGQYATFLANHDQSRTRSRLVDDGQAKIAASLQLTFPGVPFIYYGEEIGMQGTKPDENIRRPMQWSGDGGFTTGTPWHRYFDDYRERNINSQLQDTTSLLMHYDTLVDLRNQHEALRIGTWQVIETDRQPLYGFLRVSDDEIILIIVNFSKNPVEDYSISLEQGPFDQISKIALLMGDGPLYEPVMTESGGFLPYRPVELIRGHGTVMVQFLP